MTTITTVESQPIVFGEAGFTGPLTITSSGGIGLGLGYGAVTALTIPADVANHTLVNAGRIFGGDSGRVAYEYQLTAGGIGIEVGGGARITNTGLVFGGTGGYLLTGQDGKNGGTGVVISARNARLTNAGHVGGGNAGYNAIGGNGVAVSAASDVINTGLITGGNGGEATTAGGDGGDALLLSNGARLSNDGTVIGGAGGLSVGSNNDTWGGAGGTGIYLTGGSVTNRGTVIGGAGNAGPTSSGPGGGGVVISGSQASGSNLHSGAIIGGAGGAQYSPPGGSGHYFYPGYGGWGLDLKFGASFDNAGTITGGAGGASAPNNSHYTLENGGRGAVVYAATLFNSGTISGGGASTWSYVEGAYGLLGESHAVVTNTGKIFGVAVSDSSRETGGNGAMLSFSTLLNSGMIMGGAGGAGGIGLVIESAYASNSGTIRGGDGGVGGAAVQLEIKGGVFVNTGRVIGGATDSTNGAGGIGVVLESGAASTLVNAGTITGSDGQDGVLLDNGGGTVVAENGAVFRGKVVATNGVFEVAGTSASAMTGFGTKITGFTTIDFASHARWTISGDTAGLASGQTINGFAQGDRIEITGLPNGAGTVSVEHAGIVTIEIGSAAPITLDITNAEAGATNYKFANDVLSETQATQEMQFIAPAAPPVQPTKLPAWEPSAGLPPQIYGATADPAAKVQPSATLTTGGTVHDVILTQHRGIELISTLNAG